MEPLAGQNYENWGGSYYYKKGNKVFIHIGMSALPTDRTATIFILPDGYRPKSKIVLPVQGGSLGNISRLEIATDGGINIATQDGYCGICTEFDIVWDENPM